MTKKELLEHLEDFPDDATIRVFDFSQDAGVQDIYLVTVRTPASDPEFKLLPSYSDKVEAKEAIVLTGK